MDDVFRQGYIRSGRSWRRRGRKTRLFRRGTVLLVIGGGLLVLSLLGFQEIRDSDSFLIKKVEISGISTLHEEEILDLLELRGPVNMFSVDLDRLKRSLERHPWVKGAVFSREFPHRVAVTIIERRAVANLVSGTSSWLVDEEGVALSEGHRSDLPTIQGISLHGVTAGGTISDPAVKEGIEVLRTIGSHDVVIRIDHGAEVVAFVDGLPVRFGRGEYPSKWRRLMAVMSDVRRVTVKEGGEVDLRFPGKIVVRGKSG